MFSIALTGGVATGKSTFLAGFRELVPEAGVFDCDACVHQLLTRGEVTRMIASSLGEDLADSGGRLVKSLLRERVFGNAENRRTLESILHPLVRAQCDLACQEARAASIPIFIADVPLLYESGFPFSRDLEIVVACGPETQRQRLQERNGFAPELVAGLLAAQLPILQKVGRGGLVIWNGGSRQALRHQTESFLLWMKKTHRI